MNWQSTVTTKWPKTILFLFAVIFPQTNFAQYCNTTQIGPNISPLNFSSSTQGTITDNRTGLTWSRCVIGQQWDAARQTCSGVPLRFTWQQALQRAKTEVIAGQSGWRVPNAKELMSVIDFQCMLPPLNPEVFPNAPGSIDHGAWTSSPVFVYTNTFETEKNIWVVGLFNGALVQHGIGSISGKYNYLLLVK